MPALDLHYETDVLAAYCSKEATRLTLNNIVSQVYQVVANIYPFYR